MAEIPDKPALEGLEDKWDVAWNAAGTYRFDRARAAAAGVAAAGCAGAYLLAS